jgi:hypothetical protein
MICHSLVAHFSGLAVRHRTTMFKGLIMYKIEIDISAWGGDEKVTIETSDFDKIELIREFIEFQQENGWAADYEQVAEDDEEEEEELEEDEDEAVTVSTYIITKIED